MWSRKCWEHQEGQGSITEGGKPGPAQGPLRQLTKGSGIAVAGRLPAGNAEPEPPSQQEGAVGLHSSKHWAGLLSEAPARNTILYMFRT